MEAQKADQSTGVQAVNQNH